MSARIFICYASSDRGVAERLCAALEAAGLLCWMAPRDVSSGQSYAAAIVGAIRDARHFILIFSGRANHSRHVGNEVERAFSQQLAMHPLRLDATPLNADLEYFLSRPQWYDLSDGPLEQRIETFVRDFVKQAAAAPDSSREPGVSARAEAPVPATRQPRRAPVAGRGRSRTRQRRTASPETTPDTRASSDRPPPIVPENVRVVTSLSGPGGAPLCVACSPDGRTIAAGSIGALLSQHSTLHLWRARDARLLRSFADQTEMVHAVAFSPDGSVLASGDLNGVTLWNTKTGQALRTLAAGDTYAVAFSPDGRIVASGAQVHAEARMAGLDLWRVSDGRRLHRLPGHSDAVLSVAFSPSGATLASGGADETVRLWDVRTATLTRTLVDAGGDVWSLSFTAEDGPLILAGGRTGLIVWDPRARAPLKFAGATTTAKAALSPCGAIIAAACSDERIRFFRVADRKLVRTFEGPTRLLAKNRCSDVAFFPDGRSLASAWDDKQIRLLALA